MIPPFKLTQWLIFLTASHSSPTGAIYSVRLMKTHSEAQFVHFCLLMSSCYASCLYDPQFLLSCLLKSNLLMISLMSLPCLIDESSLTTSSLFNPKASTIHFALHLTLSLFFHVCPISSTVVKISFVFFIVQCMFWALNYM